MSLDALDRAGFPTDGLSSKGLDALDIEEFDIVISLMGEAGLAALPCRLTAEKIAWSIRDPYGEDEEMYDGTLRTLVRKIRRLCAERNFS
jgi:protein-tyrosine-phosphatase